jgi:hypothetical protein
MFKVVRHLRANVIAYLALFVALGGTSVAATTTLKKNSVGATQIKTAAVGSSEIKNNAIKSVDVRNGELRAVDFRASDFASLKGATGAKGDKGDKGDAGTAVAYARVNADGSLDLTRSKGLTAANVERRSTSAYCFHDLPFTVHNAVATVEYDGGAGTDQEMVQVALAGAGYTSDCNAVPNTVVEVAGYTADNYGAVPFYIVFN